MEFFCGLFELGRENAQNVPKKSLVEGKGVLCQPICLDARVSITVLPRIHSFGPIFRGETDGAHFSFLEDKELHFSGIYML